MSQPTPALPHGTADTHAHAPPAGASLAAPVPHDAPPNAFADTQLDKSLFSRLPQLLTDTAQQAVVGFGQLSITEKVLGGIFAVILTRRLLRDGPPEQHKQSKHERRDAQARTLHELLHFVNDRVEGYHKATQESQDSGRRDLYQRLAQQSQRFAADLNEQLRRLGGGQEASTTLKGKLYRRFMVAAATFTGHDENAILASNVHGERWAIHAYEEALDEHTLVGPARQLVERQYSQSRQTYQRLKAMLA